MPKSSDMEGMAGKAARMLDTLAGKTNGPHVDIPADILRDAQGLAFFTLVKASFGVGGEGGNGILVGRLSADKWSPPVAYKLGSMSAGFQVGISSVDYVMIFEDQNKLQSLVSKGMVKMGSDMEFTAGPMGQNIKHAGGMGHGGGVWTYSYNASKGAFAGISLDAGGMWVDKSENARFYNREVSAEEILAGRVDCPHCEELSRFYDMLKLVAK